MKAVKKFAFDVGWVFTGSAVLLLLNFLQKPIVARYLGPEGMGLFSMATTIASIITLIAELGISGAFVKYVAEYKDDKNKLNAIFSSAFITMIILGTVAGIVLFILSDKFASLFNMPSLSILLKISAFAFPFSMTVGTVFGLFSGLREMKYYSFFIILNGFTTFLFIAIFLIFGFGIKGAVIGSVFASILLLVIITVAVIMKKFAHFKISEYRKNMKMLASFGSQLMLGNAINNVNDQADVLLMAYFLTATDLGYYSVAISLSRFFWRLPQSIQTVAYPATSEYWAKGEVQSLNKMIDKSMKYCTVILLLIGLGVSFFANEIVIFLFKKEFISAVLPLQILLFGTVIRGSIAQPIGGSLSGIGRPDLSKKIGGFMMVINLTLDVLLIPKFGIGGAAIATTVSLIGGTVIQLYLVIKNLSLKIDTKWYLMISGVAIFAIAFFKIGSGFIDVYLLGGGILFSYIILVFIFFLTDGDKNMFKSLISSFVHRR